MSPERLVPEGQETLSGCLGAEVSKAHDGQPGGAPSGQMTENGASEMVDGGGWAADD